MFSFQRLCRLRQFKQLTKKSFQPSPSLLASSSSSSSSSSSFGTQTSKVKVASCQFLVGADKKANLQTAKTFVDSASKEHNAQIVVLPECFNSPYSTSHFPTYAESIPKVGSTCSQIDSDKFPSVSSLSQMARDNGVYLVGGSIPEQDEDNKYYNTCTIFDRDGTIVAKHRKMHLFDIDVPGGIRFMESDILSAGNEFTVFKTEYGSIGVGICYDIRFYQMSHIMTQEDEVNMLIYPAAFNTTTGPLHWELLQRARAVDHQCFIVSASPARSSNPDDYQAWGHSNIVDPWGKVVATIDETEGIVTTEIDLDQVKKIREAIPVRHQQRLDLYNTTRK